MYTASIASSNMETHPCSIVVKQTTKHIFKHSIIVQPTYSIYRMFTVYLDTAEIDIVLQYFTWSLWV